MLITKIEAMTPNENLGDLGTIGVIRTSFMRINNRTFLHRGRRDGTQPSSESILVVPGAEQPDAYLGWFIRGESSSINSHWYKSSDPALEAPFVIAVKQD